MEKNKIYNCDCFQLLSKFDDRSIDVIITDPPYGVLRGHRIETEVDIDKFFKIAYRKLKTNSFLIFLECNPHFRNGL